MTLHIDNMTLEEFDQNVGFWSGARDRWDSYTQEQKDLLESYAADCEFDSLSGPNDFVWFEANNILAENGLDEEDDDDEESEDDEENN